MAPTGGTRLRFKNARSKKPQQAKKVPSLKNRIRGLERFLSRGGIADATRRAKTTELKQLKEEQEKKVSIAQEKKGAEKCKKPRFFERVKVMRKLRQAKTRLQETRDDAERIEHEKKLQTYREEMMYIYYFPKAEPYLSLFPSVPHSIANQNRLKELWIAAIARFEHEQPIQAFDQFCCIEKDSSTTTEARPAVELLLKKPSKEQLKKQQKTRSKRDKNQAKQKRVPALVDQDDDTILEASKASDEGIPSHEKQEPDDFFL